MTNGGHFIRTITAINGDRVDYLDQSGWGTCKRTTFVKRCTHLTDAEPQQPIPVAIPQIDRAATNHLLEITIHIQNQLNVWAKSLEQSAQYYDAALQPYQKAVLKSIVKDCLDLEMRLERHRDDLAK